MDDYLSSYDIPALIKKWQEEDRRRQRSSKTKERRKKKVRFTCKDDEYKKQKPCCRSHGKIGH